ncbi:MAG: MASE1 domain-containing protein, partial [Alphaproteobacteria bacterium]|nr:MASE1 domain-containing protein [Alphaproteobacteria bacterium]
SVPGWVVANAIVALLYFGFGCIVGQFFAAFGLFPAPIWLPASIAMVAAMAGELRLLPGIFAGSLAVNAIIFSSPLTTATIISLTNALGPFAGAAMLQKLRPQRGLFTSLGGVIAFLVCTTFVSPGISAAGGALALSLGQQADALHPWSIWVSWWLCDSGGTLYLAPAIVLWLGLEREGPAPRGGQVVHDRLIWVAVALASVALFLLPADYPGAIRFSLPFMLVVPLSWIALRISLRSAYAMVTLLSIVATIGTVSGVGPFQDQSVANPLALVGALVVLLAMTVLTIVALVAERQDAQNASEMKSMFLANASHELRTPLNAIIGFSSLLESRAAPPLPPDKALDYARIIRTSGEHLLSLINDLLDVSKIEAGRFELEEGEVTLAAAIAEAVDVVAMQALAKSLTIDATPGPAGWTIAADPRALRQILLNLLSNAVKFTPPGGCVSVAATPGPTGDIEIRVSDSGIGIPAEALQRVFAPFERANRHDKHRFEGTGLGLTITRGLVALHGGTVELDSIVDHGTTVTVILPARRSLLARDRIGAGAPAVLAS